MPMPHNAFRLSQSGATKILARTKITKNTRMLLLAVYLILDGLLGFGLNLGPFVMLLFSSRWPQEFLSSSGSSESRPSSRIRGTSIILTSVDGFSIAQTRAMSISAIVIRPSRFADSFVLGILSRIQ
jgi:hypothetical protein